MNDLRKTLGLSPLSGASQSQTEELQKVGIDGGTGTGTIAAWTKYSRPPACALRTTNSLR
jgi:hypothetical protein